MTRATPIAALALLSVVGLNAQDIAGDWQGMIESPRGERRAIFKIEKDTDGDWKAVFTADHGSNGVPADSVTLRDSDLELGHDLFDHTPMQLSQPLIPAKVQVAQGVLVESHEVQHRRMDITEVIRLLHCA